MPGEEAFLKGGPRFFFCHLVLQGRGGGGVPSDATGTNKIGSWVPFLPFPRCGMQGCKFQACKKKNVDGEELRWPNLRYCGSGFCSKSGDYAPKLDIAPLFSKLQ